MHAPRIDPGSHLRSGPMFGRRPHPSRRRFLQAGAVLTSLALAGCGVRLDRDPQLPTLGSVDVLRDAVARRLAAIDHAAGEPAEAAAAGTFAEAVGPAWNPPQDLSTPVPAPNPDPAVLAPAPGLADAAGLVIAAAGELQPDTPEAAETWIVLADVAAGALVHVARADTSAHADLSARLADAAEAAVLTAETESAERAEDEGGTADDESADEGPTAALLDALVTAAYQAEYAYERAAAHLSEDTPAAESAAARTDALRRVSEAGSALSPSAHPPADAPAWDLGTRPVDHDSALAVLREAEDGITTALHRAGTALPPALMLRWLSESAAARAAADGQQDLRFGPGEGAAATGEESQ